jgi:hypothetical protein
MKYEKPEITLCESAVTAIQNGSQVKQLDRTDSILATDPAYQADE